MAVEGRATRKILVQPKLSEDLVKEIDHFSIEWGTSRSDAIERLLREAVGEQKRQGNLWTPDRA